MAFPATFNIAYYRGDTYEFYVRPKDQDGNAIDLTGYTPTFTIASDRGSSPAFSVVCDSELTEGDTVIKCTIASDDGATLTAGTVYVYDVEVADGSSPSVVQTYLTGTVSVTSDVSNS